jgi:hypothetical protein
VRQALGRTTLEDPAVASIRRVLADVLDAVVQRPGTTEANSEGIGRVPTEASSEGIGVVTAR